MQKQQTVLKRGFTLLELLVVVAILAIIAGGLIGAYDGLETKSSQGVAAYTIGALNSAVRNFHATNNSRYPTDFDSLLFSSTGDGTDAVGLNILPTDLKGKLGLHTLTSAGVTSLASVGIDSLHYVSSATTPATNYNNALVSAGGTQSEIPSRVFDLPRTTSGSLRGSGVHVSLAAGTVVAAVEGLGMPDMNGSTPADSTRLRDICGLDQSLAHLVVAFGIGNNCTMVKPHDTSELTDTRAARLAEAPYYKNVLQGEYNRYVALFHLGTSTDSSIANVVYLSKARLIGVLDTKGDWYEEELAEHLGVKK